jgi:hypothetical protein
MRWETSWPLESSDVTENPGGGRGLPFSMRHLGDQAFQAKAETPQSHERRLNHLYFPELGRHMSDKEKHRLGRVERWGVEYSR